MGCGCKKKTVRDEKTGKLVEIEVKNNLFVRLLTFSISLIIVPFLIPVIIWFLFKHLVIGGEINIPEMFTFFKKRCIVNSVLIMVL
jgi:hypothetical protein